MRKILVLAVLVAALCFAAEARASVGGVDGTNQCGPYTTFGLSGSSEYQQFGYDEFGYANISGSVKMAGYNVNSADYTQSWTGAWDVIGNDADWLQAGIGVGTVSGISQSSPYLFVEIANGTYNGVLVTDNHYKIANASEGASAPAYSVSIHASSNGANSTNAFDGRRSRARESV